MENSTFPDAELVDQINASNRRLLGIISSAGLAENFFMERITGTTLGGAIVLPTDVFQVVGIDTKVGGFWMELLVLQWQDRNLYEGVAATNNTRYHYVLNGFGTTSPSALLYPSPPDGVAYQVFIIKEPVVLALPGDKVAYPNGWEDWIVYDVAVQLLDKEDSDSRPAQVKRQRIETEITNQAQMLDRGEAPRVRDVRGGGRGLDYLVEGGGLWGI